jgi:glycosyltransferase involved in cell wall biosynthesis
MKVGLVSSAVPLVQGGYRLIVEWLADELRKRGHEPEIIYLPTADGPDTVLNEMAALRAMRFGEVFDRVITFRPPAHVIQHPRKVAWFIHHLRLFYDLWDSPYRPFPDNDQYRALRSAIVAADTNALVSAHKVFSNSRVVADRLAQYNGVDAEVLYPPVHAPERFRSGDYGDEIVCVCRMVHHKRQHLLIEALGLTKTAVRLRLCGSGYGPDYVASLRDAAARLDVGERLVIDDRWITEEEKVAILETALAAAYVPLDEDSYGYPTLEAAHARRATITLSDAGGVLEFVVDGGNGLVAEPEPASIAAVFDRLYADRALAQRLGEAALQRIDELGVNWDRVVERLLA